MTVERHLILQPKELAASTEWPPQTGGWLCLRLTAGQGYWLQSGVAVRSLSAGDVLLMGGTGKGTLRASQLGPLQLHFFTVMPQMLTGVLSLTESSQLELARHNSDLPVLFFTAKDSIGQKFAALASAPEEDTLTTRCGCLQLWAEAFSKLLTNPPEASLTDDKLRGRFRQLVGQIPQAELAAHSLTDLAAQLHCSERHFSRLFREQFGASLRSRQIELRLERARQLLTNSNAKIINVAYESGYRHVGLFNAMFKKRFGLTPSEWRRQHLNKPFAPRPVNARRSLTPILSRMAVLFLFGLTSVLSVLGTPALNGFASQFKP
jgi:AraC-like DNA-binding protein